MMQPLTTTRWGVLMNNSSVLKLVPGDQKPRASKLLCPFCGREGVKLEQLRECSPRSRGKDSPSTHITFMDGVIYEYKAHCPACARSYMQSCPADLMPKALLTGQENTNPV